MIYPNKLPKEEEKKFAIMAKIEIENNLSRKTNHEKLILHSMYEVIRLATKYHKKFYKQFDKDELIQMGSIGLINSFKRFDPNRDPYVRLSTFSSKEINGEIWRGILESQIGISIPSETERKLIKYIKENKTHEEISLLLNIPLKRTIDLINIYSKGISNFSSFEKEDGNNPIEMLITNRSDSINSHGANIARIDLKKIGKGLDFWCRKYLEPTQYRWLKMTVINFLLGEEYHSVSGAAQLLNIDPRVAHNNLKNASTRLCKSITGREMWRIIDTTFDELNNSNLKNMKWKK